MHTLVQGVVFHIDCRVQHSVGLELVKHVWAEHHKLCNKVDSSTRVGLSFDSPPTE